MSFYFSGVAMKKEKIITFDTVKPYLWLRDDHNQICVVTHKDEKWVETRRWEEGNFWDGSPAVWSEFAFNFRPWYRCKPRPMLYEIWKHSGKKGTLWRCVFNTNDLEQATRRFEEMDDLLLFSIIKGKGLRLYVHSGIRISKKRMNEGRWIKPILLKHISY
jgi:hypothetical protein